MTKDDWAKMAKGILKAELKRRNITYPELVERMRAMGVEDTLTRVRLKMSRGTFSAIFFLQVLNAIDCKNLRLD